jgi:ABC-2 type transport system permease protein
VAAYLAYTVGGQVQGLEPARKLSPFYYYLGGDPLRTGADLGHLAVLAAIPLLLAALAVWGLNRRDIAV